MAVIGASATGGAVGFILGVIFFVILDDSNKSARLGRLYRFLATFTGLGGGAGLVFGFIDIGLLPYYVGVAAVVFMVVAVTSLYLKWAGWF